MNKPLNLAQFEGDAGRNYRRTHAFELLAECKRQREQIAVLREALSEFLAAGDNSCRPDVDDVAAMLRFNAAEKQARAALAQVAK